jgi:predicted RNase H-related nuclease YkuK (DUF458 family)
MEQNKIGTSIYKDKFLKFGGERITDIIKYLKEYLAKEPTATITVGCDSIQVRRRTIYAITIMMYNVDFRKGAHIVYFRESCPKIRETQARLYKEAQYLNDIGVYINDELEAFYNRSDLSETERKRYKYHLLKSSGEFNDVQLHNDDTVMKNLILTNSDTSIRFKSIDLHADFNPFEGVNNKNKSYIAYRSYVPWLRGLGFRVWCKPLSHAATTGADLLLKKKR